MRSAAHHIADAAELLGRSLYRSNKDEARQTWIVLDFVDVVVHVFDPAARAYYDLEMLWGDAERVLWRPRAPAKKTPSASGARKPRTTRDK
jgi:ribosome-associated protein